MASLERMWNDFTPDGATGYAEILAYLFAGSMIGGGIKERKVPKLLGGLGAFALGRLLQIHY